MHQRLRYLLLCWPQVSVESVMYKWFWYGDVYLPWDIDGRGHTHEETTWSSPGATGVETTRWHTSCAWRHWGGVIIVAVLIYLLVVMSFTTAIPGLHGAKYYTLVAILQYCINWWLVTRKYIPNWAESLPTEPNTGNVFSSNFSHHNDL